MSIAGFDPCAGAGVLADIKTLEQLRVYGMAVVTGHTVQTEERCAHVTWRTAAEVMQEMEPLLRYYPIKAIKIGVVPHAAFLRTIIRHIKAWDERICIVWDPVIKSSAGVSFLHDDHLAELTGITSEIDLITPNYPEYQLLQKHIDLDTGNAILIKGGHHPVQKGVDMLRQDDGEILIHPEDSGQVPEKHGSGCVLSSAIAGYLALGENMEEACRLGKKYLEQYLKSSPALLGHHHAG